MATLPLEERIRRAEEMRRQIPAVYFTEHEISRNICRAFAKGCGAIMMPVEVAERRKTAAMYGFLRGTGEVMKERWKNQYYRYQEPFVYIDHGYINPGHYGGYYRCIWNNTHLGSDWQEDFFPEPDFNRLKKTGWKAMEWIPRSKDAPVLVSPPSRAVSMLYGIDRAGWTENVVKYLRGKTNREIIVVSKSEKPGLPLLDDAWALVHIQSNLSIEAIRRGIPVFTVEERSKFNRIVVSHPSRDFSNHLKDIETPEFISVDERMAWGAWLAASQFTLPEMMEGIAWRALTS